jgi:hypothetical protein
LLNLLLSLVSVTKMMKLARLLVLAGSSESICNNFSQDQQRCTWPFLKLKLAVCGRKGWKLIPF